MTRREARNWVGPNLTEQSITLIIDDWPNLRRLLKPPTDGRWAEAAHACTTISLLPIAKFGLVLEKLEEICDLANASREHQ